MIVMYKTIIIKNSIKYVKKKIVEARNELSNNGSIFCIVSTEYNINNDVENDFMDVIDCGLENGLAYVNTIIIPKSDSEVDNILYAVWFVKDRKEMYFDKDKIREKHIWKDVEWGKRAKNYNPKGKDPGNVWIPTVDDGKANITNHLILNNDEIYDRMLKSTLVNDDEFCLITDVAGDRDYKCDFFEGKIEFIESSILSLKDFCYKCNDFKKSSTIKSEVVFGTSENMNKINDNAVSLVVTSPPYWDLKNYFKKNQIGQESYEKYSKRINKVWQECFDKLRAGGSLWININIRTKNGKPILLPKLFINQCKKIGFSYKGILIWHKSSGIPTNDKNLVDRHEYVLVFTKGEANIIKSIKENPYNDYKNSKINGGLIWNINRKAGSIGKNTIHPAIFPTELINRIITLATNVGDIVVDPFLGSGTSLIASLNNNRNFIGYEFFEGFKTIMDERFAKEIINEHKNKIKYIN